MLPLSYIINGKSLYSFQLFPNNPPFPLASLQLSLFLISWTPIVTYAHSVLLQDAGAELHHAPLSSAALSLTCLMNWRPSPLHPPPARRTRPDLPHLIQVDAPARK